MPTYIIHKKYTQENFYQFAVTGVSHGSIIWATSATAANFRFNIKYPNERIICTKIIQNILF